MSQYACEGVRSYLPFGNASKLRIEKKNVRQQRPFQTFRSWFVSSLKQKREKIVLKIQFKDKLVINIKY